LTPRTSLRALTSAAAAAALAFAVLPATVAGAAATNHGRGSDLVARAGGHALFSAAHGTAGVFFGTQAGHTAARPSDIARDASPAQAARGWLSHYSAAFHATGALAAAGTTRVRGGDAIVRMQQSVNGLPVVGGQLVVTLDGDNNLVSVNGETTSAATADTSSTISASTAAAVARASLSRRDHGASLRATTPVLSVLDASLLGGAPAASGARTVWATTVTSTNGLLRHQVFVDAAHRVVALDIDENSRANSVVCQATAGPDTGVTDPTCTSGSGISPEVQVVAGDTAGTTPPTSSSDADTFNAYRFAHAVDDFYKTVLGRDSIDGHGGELDSTVHFCAAATTTDPNPECPMQNAFWDGAEMVYGSNYASALDVVGHEMTHGVTEKTSNLFSYYQSGAINESMSDIMGEIIQQIEGPGLNGNSSGTGTDVYDNADIWKVGEKLPIGWIRNMADPTQDAISGTPQYPADPDKMTSANYNAYSPWDAYFDNGGVHANDGVGNKAAFLMAAGPNSDGSSGVFNGVTMTGVSPAGATVAAQDERDIKVANIYYRLDQTMSSGTSYADLYNLLPQVCKALVGHALTMPAGSASSTTTINSADCAQVSLAVKATEMNKQPTAGAAKVPAPSPTCTNGGGASKKRLDNFESGNPVASTGAYSRNHAGTDSLGGKSFGDWWWSKTTVPAYGSAPPVFQDQHSTGSLWGDDADPFQANANTYDREDSWVQTKTPVAAAIGTFVRFDDAWEFDYGPSGVPGDVDANGNPVIHKYDGGRVEYSIDGGKTWYDTGAASKVDRKVLLVNGGYNGTISNTDHLFDDPANGFVYVDPNPLKGKHAFIGSSHGWTSSRLDLSSLRGKKVLLRWRVAADDSVGALGWYVDNVYAYSCNPTTASLTAPASVRKGHAASLTAHIVRAGTTSVLAKLPVQLWSRKHGTSRWVKVGTPKSTNSHGNASWAPTQKVKTDYRVQMIGKAPFAPSNAATKTVAIG
jgi:Zn-dependent metalloprotease